MRFYSFLQTCARGIVCALFRFRVKGAENIPMEGPCILAVNHISFWDPLFLAVATKHRQITFLARSSLFKKPLVGFCLKKVGALPVNRDTSDYSTLRTALSVLKDSKVIGLYPQATRCPDTHPNTTEFQGGAVYMGMVAKVPVIPIGVYTKNYRVHWFRKVTAVVGEPIVYNVARRDKEAVEEKTAEFKATLCKLCDEAAALTGKSRT